MTENESELAGARPSKEGEQDAPYVNFMEVSFELAEFRISLGQVGRDAKLESATQPAKFVTSPAHFERFQKQMNTAWEAYRAEFVTGG